MAYRAGSMLLQQQVEDAGRPGWRSCHAEPAAAELLLYCVQALTRQPWSCALPSEETDAPSEAYRHAGLGVLHASGASWVSHVRSAFRSPTSA